MRRLLRTDRQPTGSPLTWLGGLKGKDHFCQDSKRPLARVWRQNPCRASDLGFYHQHSCSFASSTYS